MNFCSQCGHTVEHRIPEGDSRLRHVCPSCHTIHYQNPRIIAGCLPVWRDKVLLCRRAIEPRHGFWTLPAGFMENGETIAEGAARETWEEAEANVAELSLYTVFNIPYINQVYMLHRGILVDGKFGVGVESLECRLFEEDEIPWDELAFPSIRKTLRHYFADRVSGEFPLRVEDLTWAAPRKTDAPA